MSRYIDADALKEMIHYTDDFYETPYVEWEDIVLAPTVDAVPVTVCASCKYDGKCMFQSFVIENSQDDVPYDRNTFYCADGKRKDNETKLKGE